MRPILLSLLALCGCPKSTPAPAAASFDPDGTLEMNWPDGLTGVRAAVRTSTRKVGDQSDETSIETHETWTARRDADGWQITSTEGVFDVVDGPEVPPMMNALAAVPLTFAVTADGAYNGVVDAKGWEAQARDAMAAVVPEGDAMQFIKADLAAQSAPLSKALQRDWFSMVELWRGLPAVPGETGQIPGTDPNGAMTTQVTRWAVSGPVACGEGGPETCLELSATAGRPMSQLEAESAPVLGAWVRALPEAPEASGVKDLAGALTVTVVVDPKTLVPYRMTRSQTMEGVATVNDDSLPFQTVDGKVITWEWDSP